MATIIIPEARTWSVERDDEGHRNYDIVHLVECTGDPVIEGLAQVLLTPGLPVIGSTWLFDGDRDDWAYCLPYLKVTPHGENEGEKPTHYRIEQKFSTKPYKRCQDNSVENPILEPQKVSGTFEKYTREATMNKNGQPLASSSHELYQGSKVEVDGNRPTVKIQQNVALLDLPLITRLMGVVNDAAMWGLPERCIKLSSSSWERQVFGTCNYYYTRSFEFDIAYETFDKRLLDHSHRSSNTRFVHLDFNCTITITVDNNHRIATVNLVSGGIGYPADMDGSVTDPPGQKDLFLQILNKRGKGGLVKVITDNLGVVTSIARLVHIGYGYEDKVAARTQMDKLTQVVVGTGRATPADPDNPTDSISARDHRGAPVKVLLDGQGKPVTSNIIQYDVNGNPEPGVGSPIYTNHRVYREDDLLLLGIPTSF